MRIKHHLPEPSPEAPFAHDKLKIERHAKALTKICDLYDDGFVLALNGEWGTGKSTFIKMWLASLQSTRPTAYFNAWSDDYNADPLPALLATFKELADTHTNASENLWNSIVTQSSKFVRKGLPPAAGFLSKLFTNVQGLDGLVEKLSEGALDLFKKEVNDFTTRKDDLTSLQDLLNKYVASTSTDKKAIVVIDELDRCRPHYAVSVLELVKHLFNVEGLVIVLAIDKEQLKHSIRGVYGSEHLDATTYLQRFIDIEYKLPKADSGVLVDYLVDQYVLGRVNGEVLNKKIKTLTINVNSFQRFIVAFQEHRNLPIRSLEKILIATKLAFDTIRPQGYLLPEFLFVLAYFNHFHIDLLKALKGKVWDTKEMLEEVQKHLTPLDETSTATLETFVHVEACFALFYNNYTTRRKKYDLNSESSYTFSSNQYGIKSMYLPENKQLKLQIDALGVNYDRLNRVSISYFIDKVEQFQEIEM